MIHKTKKPLHHQKTPMDNWKDRLPETDLTDRTLDLTLDAVEKSLR